MLVKVRQKRSQGDFEKTKNKLSIDLFFFTSPIFITGPTTSAGFLYGYVFFRQKKDPRIRRGYFQVLFRACVTRALFSCFPLDHKSKKKKSLVKYGYIYRNR